MNAVACQRMTAGALGPEAESLPLVRRGRPLARQSPGWIVRRWTAGADAGPGRTLTGRLSAHLVRGEYTKSGRTDARK